MQTAQQLASRMTDPYLMGYLSSSRVRVVTEGAGIMPRLEVHDEAGFLRAVRTKLGAGRVERSVLVIEEPEALGRVLQKYFVNAWGLSTHKAKAEEALQLLRAQAPNSPASAADTSGASSSAPPSAQQDNNTAPQSTAGVDGGSSSSSRRRNTTEHPADSGTGADTPTAAAAAATDEAAAAEGQQKSKNNRRDKNERTCVSCGGKGEKRCSACHSAWYCSRGCQKADWAEHKKVCSAYKKG